MTSNMLFFVLSLTVVSFSRSTAFSTIKPSTNSSLPNERHVQTPLEIRYQAFEVQNDGSILFDRSGDDGEYRYISIENFPLLKQGQDENSTSFRLIPENTLQTLQIGKGNDVDVSKCDIIRESIRYDDYTLYALTAYAREGVDIAPSIAYAVEAVPADVKVIQYTGEDPFDFFYFQRGCLGDWEQYAIGSELEGVVSSKCISNTGSKMPGYTGQNPSETMPAKPTKCDDNSEIVKHLVGIKYGYLIAKSSVSNDVIKKYLTRVGPIYGSFSYSNSDDYINAVFYGWEKDNNGKESWIYAKQEVNRTGTFDVYKYTEAKLPFLISGATSSNISDCFILFIDCKNPLATTCKEQVDCASIKIDTPKEDCPCPDKADKEKWEADPRTSDSKGICASGSMRVALNVIATAVVLPMLALFW